MAKTRFNTQRASGCVDGPYGLPEQSSYAAEPYTTVKTAYISSGEPA